MNTFEGVTRNWDPEAIRQQDRKLVFASSFCGVATTVWSAPANDHLVGGDWCEMFALSESLLVLSIGDVCGHGVGTANEMIALREIIEEAAQEVRDPATILARANTLAYGLSHAVPVTAIVALFDASSNMLTFANAGHPPPLMIGPGGQMFLARYPADLPLGIGVPFAATTHVVPVPPDSLLIFYTDGVTEHDRNPVKGEEELQLAAVRTYRYPLGNAAQVIAQGVLCSDTGPDDAAILTLRTPFQASPDLLELPQHGTRPGAAGAL